MESEYSILKVYVSNTDKYGMSLFYEHLVMEAFKNGIAGVTAYLGITGYGMSSKSIATSKFWEINEKLPVMVEMIDRTEVLEAFFEHIEKDVKTMGKGCLIYMQPIDVKIHQSGRKR